MPKIGLRGKKTDLWIMIIGFFDQLEVWKIFLIARFLFWKESNWLQNSRHWLIVSLLPNNVCGGILVEFKIPTYFKHLNCLEITLQGFEFAQESGVVQVWQELLLNSDFYSFASLTGCKTWNTLFIRTFADQHCCFSLASSNFDLWDVVLNN